MATAQEKSSRQQTILRMLEENSNLTAQDLAREFRVSLGTVRNDLVDLEEMGNIRRAYGKLELLARQRRDSLLNIPNTFSRTARIIGNRIVESIALIDRIFLDDSEPSHYCALHLPSRRDLHILTNSIRVAATLAWREHPGEITILPGAVQTNNLSIHIDLGDLLPSRYRVTAAFCSISALGTDGQFYVDSRCDLELIKTVAAMAETLSFHLSPDGIGKTDIHCLPMNDLKKKVAEIILDDSSFSLIKTLELDDLPIIVVGDDYALTGPFNRRAVVGYSSIEAGREYSQIIQRSIEDAARRTGNIELVITDSHKDTATALKNIDTFIQHEAQVVIEYSQLEEAGQLASEKLSHAGIRLIGVDNPIPGAIYYGVNNYEAGYVAGQKAVDFVGREWPNQKPQAILVNIEDNIQGVGNRLQGIEDVLKKNLSLDKGHIRRITCPNELEEASVKIEEMLDKMPGNDPVLVFGFNSVVTMAAVAAVDGRPDRARYAIVGQNLPTELKKELRKPDTRLIGTVNYHPESYGTEIMDIVRRLLNGEPVQPNCFAAHEWVSASRMPL